ncbi:PulJ/GspJ family protein [Desulfovibrio sp. TomC]|uniref:PulJ/GspJ family protein n=1 Tax=Desulfovibrio sp. TomC TaxID=1562888 RepID=UPI0005BD50F0|nr:type II secretion system protein [Desulfovibrio sp. TomC]
MRRENTQLSNRLGFTLIEVVAALVIMGMIALFATNMLGNAVRGYTAARNADEVAQKAQLALQRMTIEFSALDPSTSSGSATNLTYAYGGVSHTISQNSNTIYYSQSGNSYALLDGVAAGSLQFRYYTGYSSTAMTSFSSNSSINLIGVSFNMQGDDTSVGMSQSYSTRVKVNKIQ